jgi:hypothetical protein
MDEAIDTQFPFSEIYQAGREFFLLAAKEYAATFDSTKLAEQARSDARLTMSADIEAVRRSVSP